MLLELLLGQFESHPVLFFVAHLFSVHLVNGPRMGATWKDFRRRVPAGRAWVEGVGHGSSLIPQCSVKLDRRLAVVSPRILARQPSRDP